MSQFSRYSTYYDLFNQNKDYSEEVNYVLGFATEHDPKVRRILELGCGTGGHAFPLLQLGYSVMGIDLSRDMVTRAENRKAELSKEEVARARFAVGDLRTFRTDEKFDAVVSLFHVMSYQTTDSDLQRAFANARHHLPSGGLFLFDAWYGPAVIADPPSARTRTFEYRGLRGTRTSTPNVIPDRHLVEVDFRFSVTDPDGNTIESFSELHRMRYLFVPGIEDLLDRNGFKLSGTYKWLTQEPVDSSSWYAIFVAEAM